MERHGAIPILLSLAWVATVRSAAAQGYGVSDIEVPTLVVETAEPSESTTADEALDLANIVRSAAKGVTTVQEAPAIVTVVTADEIRERQFNNFQQILDTIPGWGRIGYWHSAIQSVTVRGQVQASQFLHDGVSLYDPFLNVPAVHRTVPLEMVKRVEFITGPGGVLWGSNSLLGIMNVITKDGEDVEGVEVGGTLGDGAGDRRVGRAYLMAGASEIGGTKLKLFAHGSIESYKGLASDLPLVFSRGALPQPTTPNVYGPLTTTDQQRSLMVTLNGKLSYNKLQLRWWVPFGRMNRPAGLSGNPVRVVMDPNDPTGLAAQNRFDHYDRYGVLEYRTRFARDKAGLTAHAYVQEFSRQFRPLTVLAPSSSLPGGLEFNSNFLSYRAGGAFDGDVELARSLRVLYGAEMFHEWKPINSGRSREAPGTGSDFPGPSNLTRLPLLCPRQYQDGMLVPIPLCPLTAAFDADRTVIGAYVNPQFRPNSKLILDAGARLSVAPRALGSIGYAANPSFGGAVVWNFVPSWHVKLNYTEGFRTPYFNSTQANGEGVQIGGNPNLVVEKSRAGQAEINARIFKGDRRVRELSFRLDGSYTRLTNLIQVATGNYNNSGERGIASAEFLGKLYLQGGHRIELGYTWLRADTADRGRLHVVPEHWFNLATVWSLWPKKLTATTNLKVTGAAEDANRLVEYRGLRYGDNGLAMGTVITATTDLVMDRTPPIAELFAGIQYTPIPKFAIQASVYNALFAHFYQPDAFADYQPLLEYLPNPYEGFRAYLSAALQY
jgi:outer membrane receptor protein involved in Fe transport